MLNNATIKALLESKAGQDLVKHIRQKISELDRISDIDMAGKDLGPDEIAIEVLARRRAMEKLAKIISPVLDFEEPPEPPEPETY